MTQYNLDRDTGAMTRASYGRWSRSTGPPDLMKGGAGDETSAAIREMGETFSKALSELTSVTRQRVRQDPEDGAEDVADHVRAG